jgi:hypothetical protein
MTGGEFKKFIRLILDSYDNVSGFNKVLVAPEVELKAPLRVQWDLSEEVRCFGQCC